jgi:hypothetical protein
MEGRVYFEDVDVLVEGRAILTWTLKIYNKYTTDCSVFLYGCGK